MEEETEHSNAQKKCSTKAASALRGGSKGVATQSTNNHYYHYHNHQYQRFYYPALLPLPPPIPLQLALPPPPPPPISQNHRSVRSDFVPKKHSSATLFPASEDLHRRNTNTVSVLSFKGEEGRRQQQPPCIAQRPDSGGVEGVTIPLLANHFLVKFDPSQRIFHYNVNITPTPSKEIARAIKQKLVDDNKVLLSGALPAFDGRRNLYSPVEFQSDRLDLFVTLPMPKNKHKLFRININLVSKLDGTKYLTDDSDQEWAPIPQDYLQALDIVLRESPAEKCVPVGRSLYSTFMGGSREIGGGAIGMRGFFQSVRPTQQGLALNVDLSVTAFHESIPVISYLEKRLDFLRDLSLKKTRTLSGEERKEVEKALKNIRVFVCHRETTQRYRVYGLTDDVAENLRFPDRDGKNRRLVNYFKSHYNYDIQFRNLPCLQLSRSKPCYLPMELCVICEGQKFLGKLSDEQTARILKMGCQRPRERKAIIQGLMHSPVGPTSGKGAGEFKLHVSREMTRVKGRILHPPKLKLGDYGHVKDLVPSRQDRQWNLLDSQVFEGTRIDKWALISFGGTHDQKSNIPKFVTQLAKRCEQLGIHLNKTATLPPQFEPNHVLSNVPLLESKLKNIQRAASGNLELLLCVMERKHKGYADLKRIAETSVGVVTQCLLYPNLGKLSSQFLANLALKINAKVGGCTVALYGSLPSQIPRILRSGEPVMFIGADVTHPHPLDDSSPSVAAVVGSMNWPAANKYASRMRSQTHRQEIILDMKEMVGELLVEFEGEVKKLPERIVFFRDGVSETQFYKVLEEELRAIREACSSRFPGYGPPITFAVVQKRHHTRFFPADEADRSLFDENVPPGTVVDTVVTHPKEFDFYLCSHWGVKGTSRPTHYHVLVDENRFTSDEFQKLVYNLCFTFVRCTKPISLVPPVYYAHLAAYRGRLYLERSESLRNNNITQISRASPPKTTPLPKVSDNVKKLMFYC